jgi:hypothetical protein
MPSCRKFLVAQALEPVPGETEAGPGSISSGTFQAQWCVKRTLRKTLQGLMPTHQA